MTLRVMAWLSDAGIRGILLKGGALRSWLYREGGVRTYADIDVLVSPDQLDAAATLMKARGWTESPYPSPIGHAVHLRPPDGDLPIPLDLHRSFHYCAVAPTRVWELLSAHTAPLRLGDREIEALDETALAVIVALHHVGHGGSSQPTEDLERAVAQAPLETWREAARLAASLGAAAAFSAAVRDVEGGTQLAAELGLSEVTDPALHLALATSPPTADMQLRLGRQRAHPLGLLRVLAGEAFPTPLRMREHYPLARRGLVGLLAAYLTRPFVLAPQLAAGRRATVAAQAQAKRPSSRSAPVPMGSAATERDAGKWRSGTPRPPATGRSRTGRALRSPRRPRS